MIKFFKTPWITRASYSELTWKLTSDESIYLTFDDGPSPEVTPWVMQELAKVDAKATFFCLGKNLEKNRELAESIMKAGHTIGNHTHNHLNGWHTQNFEYQEDIRVCDEVLMELGIYNRLFRPPYGRIKKSQLRGLKNRRVIMWSHLSWDFDKKLNVQESIKKLKRAEAGSILVFHDTIQAFKNLKIILPEILSYFSNKGYKFDAVR